MKRVLPLFLLLGLLCSLSSCEQLVDKLTGKGFKGVYLDAENSKLEITDKKVIASTGDKGYPMTIAFNYEVEGKRLFLEPASTGGLGSLMMAMGSSSEIQIIDDKVIKYVVGSQARIYKRVSQ